MRRRGSLCAKSNHETSPNVSHRPRSQRGCLGAKSDHEVSTPSQSHRARRRGSIGAKSDHESPLLSERPKTGPAIIGRSGKDYLYTYPNILITRTMTDEMEYALHSSLAFLTRHTAVPGMHRISPERTCIMVAHCNRVQFIAFKPPRKLQKMR